MVEEIAFGDCSEEERDSVVIYRRAPLPHGAVDCVEYAEGITAGGSEVWFVAGVRSWGGRCWGD